MSEPRPRSLLPLTHAQERVVLAIADASTLWESPNLFVSWLQNLGLGESPEALRAVAGRRR